MLYYNKDKEKESITMNEVVLNYLNSTYSLIDNLKTSDKSKIDLVYDKIAKRVCVRKYLKDTDKHIYQNLQKLDHRILPKIYRLFSDEQTLIVIEEYINGQTLAELVQNRLIKSDAMIEDILIQLCEGLAVLHKRNIIYHDLKLANVMVNSDHIVKLIDFDISRTFKQDKDFDTRFLGTEGYVAPEQVLRQSDDRSDIYSLGILLKKLAPKSPILLNIINKATQIDPENRYQSVAEILAQLQGRFKHITDIPLSDVETMLKQYFTLFEVPIPVQQRDYPIIISDYQTIMPADSGEFTVYDTQEEAIEAGIAELDKIIYSCIDEYILDILNYYKITCLKKYYDYKRDSQNFYYYINEQIETILHNMDKRLRLNLPDYLKHFALVPDFTRFSGEEEKQNFHLWQLKHVDGMPYLAEIRQEFYRRTCSHTAGEFAFYCEDMYDIKVKVKGRSCDVKVPKWFGLSSGTEKVAGYFFIIDDLYFKCFEELVRSMYAVMNDNPNLQEDVEGVITKSYLPQLQRALTDKTHEILDFLKQNQSK